MGMKWILSSLSSSQSVWDIKAKEVEFVPIPHDRTRIGSNS
uniref:Uncharacterized protein n=1 Tax=Nelumbo nucifera TaxID=4432 RepID=A0A822Y9F5_NELNU|nr:TPA_asm: hypothetical protein HUJ06_009565 [Nelumbo nucifera]